MQCDLARELKLPVIIHSRDAFDETLEIVSNYALYFEKNNRNPTWSELMTFMAELPNVDATYHRKRVHDLVIEGCKPLDREAFSKRFRRYFKKIGH